MIWTVVLEKTLESPLDGKEIQSVHPKGDQSWMNWCWIWNSNTLATWCKGLTHWKIPWCWGRLKAGGEGEDRGWDGWMASPPQWTWVWVNSGSWCWTGRPGMLQSTGSQSWTRLSDWSELNWRFPRAGDFSSFSCYLWSLHKELARWAEAGPHSSPFSSPSFLHYPVLSS